MALSYKASLPLSGLAVPLFSLFGSVLFALSLQLTALIQLSLSLNISFALPSIAIALALTLNLIIQFNLALGLQLPSLALALSLAIDFELVLDLGFIAALKAIIDAIINASLVAYGWYGSSQALGAALTSELQETWPDGTTGDAEITAILFVATTSGGFAKDQIASLVMMPQPSPPPTPQNPSPPPDSYPPPQAYENGLAGVKISAPTGLGGTQATGTVTVDNSVGPGIGAITSVTITNHGSGYTSQPFVSVSDEVDIVGATSAAPIVVTLPNPLTIPPGTGIGVTIGDVAGSTEIISATATTPIVITVASTTNLVSLTIPDEDFGLDGLGGQWFAKILSSSEVELWKDSAFTIPSSGDGVYAGGAKLAGNINGIQNAKVLTATTVALYADSDMTLPVKGFGTYTGGTFSGGGAGAAVLAVMGGGPQRAIQDFLNGMLWPTSTGLVGKTIAFKAMLGATFDLMLALQGNLEARAKLLGSIKLGVDFIPPSISASIELLGKIAANFRANLKVKLPNLSASVAAALSAQINAVADLVARIGFLLGLGSFGGELEIWEYTGPGSGLGAAIAAGPGAVGWHDGTPNSVPVVAGVFGLTNPESVTAFKTFFPGA